MSTNITQVPAHIAARMAARKAQGAPKSAITAALAGDAGIPRISIRAGRFRLVEGGVETVVGTELDVVIVGANPNTSKAFYSKPYDPNNQEVVLPDCFSHDGVRPHPSAKTPISATCATCPNNVLGSKITPNGNKSKLCGDSRHLAMVPASDPNKVYQLSVPVTSMTNMRNYVKHLDNYGAVPEEVVTTLQFDTEASAPKLVFVHKSYLSDKALPIIERIMQSDEVKIATSQMDYSGRQAALPPAETAATAALPSAAVPPPAPVQAPVEPPPTVAPPVPTATPVQSAPPPTPAPVATPTASVDDIEKALGDIFGS